MPWHDPNVRLVDLTGDGLADLLVAANDGFIWYPSLGEHGFGLPEATAPAVDDERRPQGLADIGREAVYLADMSGDGTSDIVRIGNAEVCYWPNVGFGRFGPKVTMDRAPRFDEPDQFDPQRLRLADIDGSGSVDLVYLGRTGVDVYSNESGNGWTTPRRLTQFPKTDDLSSVFTVDMLGNGTVCLVWSSPLPADSRTPVRYVDLMGGQKPHLLVRTTNNLGAETLIDYAPSTKFYVADRLAGRPWATQLPFPVHVVERVTARDRWRKHPLPAVEGTNRLQRTHSRSSVSTIKGPTTVAVKPTAPSAVDDIAKEASKPPSTLSQRLNSPGGRQAVGNAAVAVAGAIVALGSYQSAKGAERESTEALQRQAPGIEKYLVDNPTKGVLIVSTFRSGAYPDSSTYTEFVGHNPLKGFESEAAARSYYDAAPAMGRQLLPWTREREWREYTWIPPVATRQITVGAPR